MGKNTTKEKPNACRMRNPVTGRLMLIGCAAAAKWLVDTRRIAKISVSTVRAIADGRAENLRYNPDTIALVKREFPKLCGGGAEA